MRGDPRRGEGAGVWQARRAYPEKPSLGQYRRDPPLGVVPKSGEPARLVRLASRGLESGRETNRRRDIFGPGAATAFLPAAPQDRVIYMETLPGEG